MELTVLQRGSCEPLKAGVHAAAFGLFAIMSLYNAAAWLTRRQTHLGVNAVVYSTLTIWEKGHVVRHLAELRRCRETFEDASVPAPRAATTLPGEVAA